MGTEVTMVTAVSACTVFSGDGYGGGSAVSYDHSTINKCTLLFVYNTLSVCVKQTKINNEHTLEMNQTICFGK